MIGRSKGNERSADLHVTLYGVLLDVCGSPISNSSKSKYPPNIFTAVYPSIHETERVLNQKYNIYVTIMQFTNNYIEYLYLLKKNIFFLQ
jgi:hypothetical protein